MRKTARDKLNSSAILGILITAGLAAHLFGSWEMFWLVALVLFALAINSGDIRF